MPDSAKALILLALRPESVEVAVGRLRPEGQRLPEESATYEKELPWALSVKHFQK